MPYEQVVQMWRRCITTAYEPEFLYQRFAYNIEHTYSKRIEVPIRFSYDDMVFDNIHYQGIPKFIAVLN